MCKVEELIEIAEYGTNNKHKNIIPAMDEQIEKFEELWNMEEEAFEKFLTFSKEFNECWNIDEDIFFISIYIELRMN